MRRFKFDKPLVESAYPPESKNVLWVDINESTGSIISIKEFKKGDWVDIVSNQQLVDAGVDVNPDFPEPNEIYAVETVDGCFTIDTVPNGGFFEDYPQIISIDTIEHRRWGTVKKVTFDRPLPEEFPNYMFYENWTVYKIWLPKHTKFISYKAFYNCGELVEIYLPEGLVGIGEKAFLDLYSFSINDKIDCIFPSTLRYLGEQSMALNLLRSVKAPDYLDWGSPGAFLSSNVDSIMIRDTQLDYTDGQFIGSLYAARMRDYGEDMLIYIFEASYNDVECLLPGTQILIDVDGNTKNIEDLVIGDTIITYDGKDYIVAELDKVINVKHTFYLDIIFVNDTKISISPDHAILTEEGWKSYKPYLTETPEKVSRLIKKDKVFLNGEYVGIKDIILHTKPDTVMYNIGVKGYNNYIANGVCVYECSGSK